MSTKEKIVFYCATCDQSVREATLSDHGKPFYCPNQAANAELHVARAVKLPSGKTWLRIEKCIRDWQLKRSPAQIIPFFRDRTVIYMIARFLVAVVLGFAAFASANLGLMIAIFLLAIYLLIDVVLSNTSVAFITRFPTHPIRSVILALVSVGTVAVLFSVFYSAFRDCFAGVSTDPTSSISFSQAFYFSFITIATVGYGDIHPAPDATVLQMLVVTEIAIGLYFIAVIVSVVGSWSGGAPGSSDPIRLPEDSKDGIGNPKG